MYHPAHIAALSKKQVSKLLNGHPVRVRGGGHHKIHISAEHHKKLHKAHAKGCGITLTLDPYAIEHNQHLRHDVGMGGKLGQNFGKFIVHEGLEPLITAGVERGVRGIQTGHGIMSMAKAFTPKPMRRMVSRNIKRVGGNVNRGKKFDKWMGKIGHTIKSIGDYIKPVAKPLLRGATNMALSKMGQPSLPSGPRQYPKPVIAQVATSAPEVQYYPDVSELNGASDLGLPPLPDNYEIPYGKAYAAGIHRRHKPKSNSHGMGRKKAHRPKRIMSEAQKAALAKGRAALRIRLNEMGAGRKTPKHRKTPKRRHTGKSLMPAGY